MLHVPTPNGYQARIKKVSQTPWIVIAVKGDLISCMTQFVLTMIFPCGLVTLSWNPFLSLGCFPAVAIS
jgi:hypothetical protein